MAFLFFGLRHCCVSSTENELKGKTEEEFFCCRLKILRSRAVSFCCALFFLFLSPSNPLSIFLRTECSLDCNMFQVFFFFDALREFVPNLVLIKSNRQKARNIFFHLQGMDSVFDRHQQLNFRSNTKISKQKV